MTRSGWFEFAVLFLFLGAVGTILGVILPAQLRFLELVAVSGLLVSTLAVTLMMLRRMQVRSSDASRDLAAIQQLSTALGRSEEPDEGLSQALDAILELTHAAAIRLWFANSEKRELEFRLHRGLFPEAFGEPVRSDFEGIPAGRAAASKQTVLLRNPVEFPALHAKGFVEIASVPVCSGDRVVGILDIAARHQGELDWPVLRRIEHASPALALAIDYAKRVSAAERRAADARGLWQAGLGMAAAAGYGQTFQIIADCARDLVQGQAAAVCLWDEQKQWWTVQGTSGASDAFDLNVKRLASANGTAECSIVRTTYRHARLDAPMVREGRTIGCVCVATKPEHESSSQKIGPLADLAGQAAIAIENSRRADRSSQHAVVAERERLAREMHDTLAQLLGFVSFKTQATREFLAQGHIDRADAQLDQLMTISQELYAETRELILGLSSEVGPERELIPALDEYVRRFSQLSGITTTFEPDGISDVHLAPMVEVQLIRVVQEALSNVRKHAQASRARVRLERVEDRARVTIEDDGQGFDLLQFTRGKGPRFGMQSMRERVESVGGTLAMRSALGGGTHVTVQVPIVYRGGE